MLVCRWANVNDLVQNKFRSTFHPLSHHLLDQIHWWKHQMNVQDPKNLMHWLLIHLILLTFTILTQPPEQNSEAAAEYVLKNFANFTGKHLFWSLPFFTKLQSFRPATPTQVISCEIREIHKNNCFEEHVNDCFCILLLHHILILTIHCSTRFSVLQLTSLLCN